MKKLLGSAIIVFILAQVCFGGGYFKTGMMLMADAREWSRYYQGGNDFSPMDASHFQGYVCGVLDAHGETIKIPDGFTIDQACAIVWKFLAEHPKRPNEPAALLDGRDKVGQNRSFKNGPPG